MVDVIVVGGGPAGLSAALFGQKNGLETVVFDTDDTWLHKAHLFNYLGVGSQDGTAFLETARRQVESFGVDHHQGEAVTDVESTGDGFRVMADDDHKADYLVLATGADRDLAAALGCEFDGDVVDRPVDGGKRRERVRDRCDDGARSGRPWFLSATEPRPPSMPSLTAGRALSRLRCSRRHRRGARWNGRGVTRPAERPSFACPLDPMLSAPVRFPECSRRNSTRSKLLSYLR